MGRPYTVEYYYKVKWGYAEEFLRLFKKNHLPLLKKLVELGRLEKIDIARPHYHATEDGRWDFRVTLIWKDISLLTDGFDEKALARDVFAGNANFAAEEQRRFDILLAHWDLPVVAVPDDN